MYHIMLIVFLYLETYKTLVYREALWELLCRE